MTTTAAAPPSFSLDVHATPRGRSVRASGRLLVGAGADHPTWTALGAGDALEHVTLDLEAVTAVDAAGLGRLLRVRQRLGARGARLSIGGVSPRVGRVLSLTGLSDVFGLSQPSRSSAGPSEDGSGTRQAMPHESGAASSLPLLCRCA